MAAGGHPSRWKEIKLSETTKGVLEDRLQNYRKSYERMNGECSETAMPPPPATAGANATYFKGKYGGADKVSTPYSVFKDCFPDEVRRGSASKHITYSPIYPYIHACYICTYLHTADLGRYAY